MDFEGFIAILSRIGRFPNEHNLARIREAFNRRKISFENMIQLVATYDAMKYFTKEDSTIEYTKIAKGFEIACTSRRHTRISRSCWPKQHWNGRL